MKTWDEKVEELTARLGELNEKVVKAQADVKEAQNKAKEKIEDDIATVKGEIAAFQENVKCAEEEGKSKLNSALLKAQMTVEQKVQEVVDKADKAYLEHYMDNRAIEAAECLDMADYLIANAIVDVFEMVEAGNEYYDKFVKEEE